MNSKKKKIVAMVSDEEIRYLYLKVYVSRDSMVPLLRTDWFS